jgi:hypothetical protein
MVEKTGREQKNWFHKTVSRYGLSGRKHVEIPKSVRDNFDVGDVVIVKKVPGDDQDE